MEFKELLEIVTNGLKDLSTLENPDFRLEQIEYKKDEHIWEVVVSFLVEKTNKRISMTNMITPEFQYSRRYKLVKINDRKEITGVYIFNDKE